MNETLKNFKTAGKLIWQDKIILLLCLLPIAIGIALFAALFDWMMADLKPLVLAWLPGTSSSSGILEWSLVGILTWAFYFIVSFFFVFVVSLVASPFNDLISARVEKSMGGKNSSSAKSFLWVLGNEVKKLACLGAIGLVAFLFGLLPILLPVSFALSALLISANFLDYNWSRHNLNTSGCIKDIKKSLLAYGIAGAIFLFAFTIPLLNLILLPYATVYYSSLYLKFNFKE